jgi:hypothetical protein
MFNPSLPGENRDAPGASTDGRATLYMDDEMHMFGERCNEKNNGGGLNIKKKPSIFDFPI